MYFMINVHVHVHYLHVNEYLQYVAKFSEGPHQTVSFNSHYSAILYKKPTKLEP